MHKMSWRQLPFSLLGLSFFILLAGCGKGFEEQEEPQEEEYVGHYRAVFKPLNQRFGRMSGWAAITITDNQFWARVRVGGRKTTTMHAQFIHSRGRCPGMTDDLNGDGYLDFLEAYRIAGPILVPLDANLNSQLKGMHEFPLMKRKSHYFYSEAASYDRMMEDLRGEDYLSDDMISKLSEDELELERRVVMIYGINEDNSLPSTVRSYTGYPAQYALPIACGELQAGDGEVP